ncbi:MAG: helix-turn-helix transcriptional regulator [Actinobacteria bacterium]|jgi:ArsR family transcriptional regulator|nr:helix-turn-helix transcriptional regulator [Actinomycetota bacterium]
MPRSRTLSVDLASAPACCPNGLATPLDRESAERLSRLLKAVADPARLQVLSLIKASPDGEVCQCDLTVPLALSQPTVSHHLRVLTDAGLLDRTTRGTWAWYSVNADRLAELAAVLR